jgi:hypothetical protein
MHVWGTENSNRHGDGDTKKCMTQCAISSFGIVRPIFLDDTVNAVCYLKLLQGHFVPTLQGMGVNMEEIFFQEDGARPHTVKALLHFLSKHFH